MPNRGNFGGGGRGGSRGGPPHINPDGDWICSQLDELKRSIERECGERLAAILIIVRMQVWLG